MREVIAAVEEVTGLTVAVREGPRREGDPAILFADAGEARQTLRWIPRRSDLRNIVSTARRWLMTRP